jgi:hypothetical protein
VAAGDDHHLEPSGKQRVDDRAVTSRSTGAGLLDLTNARRTSA